MIIGAVPNPRMWERWSEAEALLEPARARGDFATVLDDDELLFAVLDGDDLLAVATAWRGVTNKGETFVEVKLIGGHDHRRWLEALDDKIGAEARVAGASRMIGIGRRGWARELQRLGWAQSEKIEDHWLFVREL